MAEYEFRELVKNLRDVFESIRKNDATCYEHHQPRRFDGKKPTDVGGGTRWLEPREMAMAAIKAIDRALAADVQAAGALTEPAPDGQTKSEQVATPED